MMWSVVLLLGENYFNWSYLVVIFLRGPVNSWHHIVKAIRAYFSVVYAPRPDSHRTCWRLYGSRDMSFGLSVSGRTRCSEWNLRTSTCFRAFSSVCACTCAFSSLFVCCLTCWACELASIPRIPPDDLWWRRFLTPDRNWLHVWRYHCTCAAAWHLAPTPRLPSLPNRCCWYPGQQKIPCHNCACFITTAWYALCGFVRHLRDICFYFVVSNFQLLYNWCQQNVQR